MNVNDFYFADQDGYKLKPKGMSLICYYYRNKHHLNNLFVASDYEQLEKIIILLLQQDSNNNARFGIVYRNIPKQGLGFSHKCAVIIQSNTAIVLDPFGGYGGNINFARMGADHIKSILTNLGKSNLRIYTPRLKVQSDASSCSTLCFLFLKEALRMGDELLTFLHSADIYDEEDDLPPALAKYTQNIHYLDNQKKTGLMNKYPQHNDYKIPIRNLKRQQTNNSKTENLRQYIDYHKNSNLPLINPAAANRAYKHIKIINLYLEQLTLQKLEDILQETTHPNAQSLLTINHLPSIDPLIRIKPKHDLFLPANDEQDNFDVFDFLENDNKPTETYKLKLL